MENAQYSHKIGQVFSGLPSISTSSVERFLLFSLENDKSLTFLAKVFYYEKLASYEHESF